MFGFTEVKLGILPAVISPFVLAKIGVSAARELFLTGARFSAARAREIGLVHAVVPQPTLDAAVERVRPRAARRPAPSAIAAAKALIRDGRRRAPDATSPSLTAETHRRAARLGRRPGRDARVPREAPSLELGAD